MIKGMRTRIIVDDRGKVTTGRINPANGYPQSLSYFNLEAFPELQKLYPTVSDCCRVQPESMGDIGTDKIRVCPTCMKNCNYVGPTELILYFPSNEEADIFDCSLVVYGGGKNGTKIRSCNGESCIHRINEEVGDQKFAAGEESACVCFSPEGELLLPETVKKDGKEKPNPQICRYVAYMKAWVANPSSFKVENPIPFLFHTGSRNSGDNLYSTIKKVLYLSSTPNEGKPGHLKGIPFKLSVNMVEGKSEAKKKFPIWELREIGMVSDLRQDRMLGQSEGASAPQLVEASVVEEQGEEDSAPAVFANVEPSLQEKSTKQRVALESHIKKASTLDELYNAKKEVDDSFKRTVLTEIDRNELLEQIEDKAAK